MPPSMVARTAAELLLGDEQRCDRIVHAWIDRHMSATQSVHWFVSKLLSALRPPLHIEIVANEVLLFGESMFAIPQEHVGIDVSQLFGVMTDVTQWPMYWRRRARIVDGSKHRFSEFKFNDVFTHAFRPLYFINAAIRHVAAYNNDERTRHYLATSITQYLEPQMARGDVPGEHAMSVATLRDRVLTNTCVSSMLDAAVAAETFFCCPAARPVAKRVMGALHHKFAQDMVHPLTQYYVMRCLCLGGSPSTIPALATLLRTRGDEMAPFFERQAAGGSQLVANRPVPAMCVQTIALMSVRTPDEAPPYTHLPIPVVAALAELPSQCIMWRCRVREQAACASVIGAHYVLPFLHDGYRARTNVTREWMCSNSRFVTRFVSFFLPRVANDTVYATVTHYLTDAIRCDYAVNQSVHDQRNAPELHLGPVSFRLAALCGEWSRVARALMDGTEDHVTDVDERRLLVYRALVRHAAKCHGFVQRTISDMARCQWPSIADGDWSRVLHVGATFETLESLATIDYATPWRQMAERDNVVFALAFSQWTVSPVDVAHSFHNFCVFAGLARDDVGFSLLLDDTRIIVLTPLAVEWLCLSRIGAILNGEHAPIDVAWLVWRMTVRATALSNRITCLLVAALCLRYAPEHAVADMRCELDVAWTRSRTRKCPAIVDYAMCRVQNPQNMWRHCIAALSGDFVSSATPDDGWLPCLPPAVDEHIIHTQSQIATMTTSVERENLVVAEQRTHALFNIDESQNGHWSQHLLHDRVPIGACGPMGSSVVMTSPFVDREDAAHQPTARTVQLRCAPALPWFLWHLHSPSAMAFKGAYVQ